LLGAPPDPTVVMKEAATAALADEILWTPSALEQSQDAATAATMSFMRECAKCQLVEVRKPHPTWGLDENGKAGLCYVCGDPGEVYMCDTDGCPNVCHEECLAPSSALPDASEPWYCCSCAARPALLMPPAEVDTSAVADGGSSASGDNSSEADETAAAASSSLPVVERSLRPRGTPPIPACEPRLQTQGPPTSSLPTQEPSQTSVVLPSQTLLQLEEVVPDSRAELLRLMLRQGYGILSDTPSSERTSKAMRTPAITAFDKCGGRRPGFDAAEPLPRSFHVVKAPKGLRARCLLADFHLINVVTELRCLTASGPYNYCRFRTSSARGMYLAHDAGLNQRMHVVQQALRDPTVLDKWRTPCNPSKPDWARMQQLADAWVARCPCSGVPVIHVSKCSPSRQTVVWSHFCAIAKAVNDDDADDLVESSHKLMRSFGVDA